MRVMKHCNDCQAYKPFSEFSRRTTRAGTITVAAYCRKCMVRRSREWQNKNRERYNGYQRVYTKRKKGITKVAKKKNSTITIEVGVRTK